MKFNNPFRDYHERKRREREQTPEHRRLLDLISEQERREHEKALENSRRLETYEARLRAGRNRSLRYLAAGVLIGAYLGMHWRTPVERHDLPVSSGSGSGASPDHEGIKGPEPACTPTVGCLDGTMSCSSGSGTCSDHGGIKPTEPLPTAPSPQTSGEERHRHFPASTTPESRKTVCADGFTSPSSGSGACSHHGGIRRSDRPGHAHAGNRKQYGVGRDKQ